MGIRNIIFRGKTEQGEWLYGYLVKGNYNTGFGIIEDNIDTGLQYVEEETIGQFTGLIDKNGEKVFEGDILVFCKGATYPYKIEWDCMGWKLYRSDGKRIKEQFECNEAHYVNISEVIGNIHDNKELLGEEK